MTATAPVVTRSVKGLAKRGGSVARVLVMLSAMVFFGLPIVWLLLAVTKTDVQLLNGHPLTFGSFGKIGEAWRNLQTFNDGEIIQWIWNSIYYSAVSVGLSVALCVPAGYALAKYTFIGRKPILTITLIAMMVPPAALVLPLYLEMVQLKLIDTPAAVILPLSFYPFGVYLSYLFYSSNVPNELMDAARLDGCSEIGLFARLGIPLGRSLVPLIGFFAFVNAWTSFFLPFVMLTDDRRFTLQLGLKTLIESTGAVNGGSAFASLPIKQPEAALAALISVAPILVAFLFSQRFLISGQLAGSSKG